LFVSVVGFGLLACSTSGGGAAGSATSTGHLQSALDRNCDATTEAAAKTLVPVLDAADWDYLTAASWPADAPTVLADPRLQRAMTPFLSASTTTTKSAKLVSITGPLPRSLTPLTDTIGQPQIQSILDAAAELMRQANGRPMAGTPGAAVAFAQLLGQAMTVPLPPPGGPADVSADTRTVEFFKGGASTATDTSPAPCCIGTLTFPGGELVCQDAASCKGKGEPPPGTITFAGSGNAGQGCDRSNPNIAAGHLTVSTGEPCGSCVAEGNTIGVVACKSVEFGSTCVAANPDSDPNGERRCRAHEQGACVATQDCYWAWKGSACQAGACCSLVEQNCTADSGCCAGLICNGTSCRVPLDGACTPDLSVNSNLECALGLFCDGGKCVPAICISDTDCRSGKCDTAAVHCARAGSGGQCLASGKPCDAKAPQTCCSSACAALSQDLNGPYACQ
jgi:hypothetical protein